MESIGRGGLIAPWSVLARSRGILAHRHPTRARSSCIAFGSRIMRDTLTRRVDAKKPGVLDRADLFELWESLAGVYRYPMLF